MEKYLTLHFSKYGVSKWKMASNGLRGHRGQFSDCSSFLIDVSSKTSHLSRLQQSKYNSDTDSVFGVLPVNIMVGVSNVDN